MTPETEVIACPACKHLLRVPLDWLGTQVQCPECKAMFLAPVRENGKLSEPELLSRPGATQPAAPKPKSDAMLLLPAFGLLLCGVAGTLVNAVMMYQIFGAQDGGHAWAKQQVEATRQAGFGKVEPEKQAERDEQDTAELLRLQQWMLPTALAVSVLVFWGGLSMALRRNYRLAQIGCVLAAVNIAHLCCVPGAVAGLWGLLMLNSDEGRDHFRR